MRDARRCCKETQNTDTEAKTKHVQEGQESTHIYHYMCALLMCALITQDTFSEQRHRHGYKPIQTQYECFTSEEKGSTLPLRSTRHTNSLPCTQYHLQTVFEEEDPAIHRSCHFCECTSPQEQGSKSREWQFGRSPNIRSATWWEGQAKRRQE